MDGSQKFHQRLVAVSASHTKTADQLSRVQSRVARAAARSRVSLDAARAAHDACPGLNAGNGSAAPSHGNTSDPLAPNTMQVEPALDARGWYPSIASFYRGWFPTTDEVQPVCAPGARVILRPCTPLNG